jgi:type I restriction enzyme M protein
VRKEEIAGHNHNHNHNLNLNLLPSIDSSEAEDIPDREAYLRGGIPECAIDILETYGRVCPQLHEALFWPLRPGYLELAVAAAELKGTITAHPQFWQMMVWSHPNAAIEWQTSSWEVRN